MSIRPIACLLLLVSLCLISGCPMEGFAGGFCESYGPNFTKTCVNTCMRGSKKLDRETCVKGCDEALAKDKLYKRCIKRTK